MLQDWWVADRRAAAPSPRSSPRGARRHCRARRFVRAAPALARNPDHPPRPAPVVGPHVLPRAHDARACARCDLSSSSRSQPTADYGRPSGGVEAALGRVVSFDLAPGPTTRRLRCCCARRPWTRCRACSRSTARSSLERSGSTAAPKKVEQGAGGRADKLLRGSVVERRFTKCLIL